jgi:hypothetical protein
MDELLASGALTDLSTPVDDIQAELDKVSAGSQVDAELAALRSQLASAGPSGALGAAGSASAPGGASEAEATEAEIVEPAVPPAGGAPAPGTAPVSEAASEGPR